MSSSHWARWIAVLGLVWIVQVRAGAMIEVTPDRNPVGLDETFNLIFSANAKPDEDPDFRPLEKDFEILGQSQSSQVSIVNGSFTKKTEWVLNVMARRAGTLTIPAIAFGTDRSQPRTVEVQSGTNSAPDGGDGRSQELFLEVDAEPKNPYVQAQTILSVRLFRRINFSSGDLSEPTIPNALVERLGEDRQFTADRGGQRYGVIERKYAVFPQQSGRLHIEPITLEARISGGGGSPFNRFFNQPSRIARLRSEALDLDVRPVPAQFNGKHWLPAEQLELEESWSKAPPRTVVGEPITRTLSLRATGATVGVLPELDVSAGNEAKSQLKLYRDQPVLNEEKQVSGMRSLRQEKIAYLASQAGKHPLPALEIPWWNTRTDRMEFARLPAQELHIDAMGNNDPQPDKVDPVPSPAAPAQAPDSPEGPTRAPSIDTLPGNEDFWFWVAMVSTLGWLATSLAWWRGRPAPGKSPKAAANETPGAREKQRLQVLREACASDDAQRARQALMDWGKARYPALRLSRLAELAQHGSGELAAAIDELERALYGQHPAGWHGGPLLKALDAISVARSGATSRSPDLEPLYRSG